MNFGLCIMVARVRARALENTSVFLHRQLRQISVHATWGAASPISNKTHYERLGLERDAAASDIKASYLQLAKVYHPDRAADPDVSEHIFRDIAEAYEILKDAATRARILIEKGDVDAAIVLWREAGAAFQELLHIIDCCTREMKVPSDLPTLLFHLHSVEKQGTQTSVDGVSVATSSETAVMNFVERKTRAYNELIRLCDMCGTRKQLFEVLDAMERNCIPIDMETLAQLEDVFTRGTVRDNPNRGR